MDQQRPPDTAFVGSVPDVYDRLLVPMIFAEAAAGLAAEVAALDPRVVLETADGTGALTRALVRACPEASVVATDLNEPMLAVAAAALGAQQGGGRVTWAPADAQRLTFADDSFDVVACQF